MLVRVGLEGRCIVHCGVSLLWGWVFATRAVLVLWVPCEL